MASWLIEQGLKGPPVEEQFARFCERLHDAGISMDRAFLALTTLHPRYGALSFIWDSRSRTVKQTARSRGDYLADDYKRSPISFLASRSAPFLRRRLDVNEPLEFPVLEDMRQMGMSEFAAKTVPFGSSHAGGAAFGWDDGDTHGNGDPLQPPRPLEGIYFSCATRRPGGFDDERLEQVSQLLPYLALGVKSRITYDVASTVLATYLGEDAGQRVLTGRIQRGAADSIRSVVWLCDLRGYTRTTDALPRDQLVETLDDHLDVMARPLLANGGQILKFLGDGFLAIFNLEGLEDDSVCSNALKAAGELRNDFAAFKSDRLAAGKPVMDFGLALHLGDVLYGNIGSGDRLDFTVIGPAVNEAGRIEQLCRPLGRDILISSTFHKSATHCRALMMSLGAHELRDVPQPRELFTLIPV